MSDVKHLGALSREQHDWVMCVKDPAATVRRVHCGKQACGRDEGGLDEGEGHGMERKSQI